MAIRFKGIKKIGISSFKSFKELQTIELSPLTVLLGANSSGKTSFIQPLLLLNQTLKYAPADTVLKIDGPLVNFSSLNELTYHNKNSTSVEENVEEKHYPEIILEWDVEADLSSLRKSVTKSYDKKMIQKHLNWLEQLTDESDIHLTTRMHLQFMEVKDIESIHTSNSSGSKIILRKMELTSIPSNQGDNALSFRVEITNNSPEMMVAWYCGSNAKALGSVPTQNDKLFLNFNRFIPSIQILGGTEKDKALTQAFAILFRKPLELIEEEIKQLSFIGPLRAAPQRFYVHSSTDSGIDSSGEMLAQTLAIHQNDIVHYVPLIELDDKTDEDSGRIIPGKIKIKKQVETKGLLDAVNGIIKHLGFNHQFEIDGEAGRFYEMFTKDNRRNTLVDVGFGVSQILPIVVTGLLADYLRNSKETVDNLNQYTKNQNTTPLIILEQPEIHLHPRTQSLLAQFIVALALSGRRFIMETHSDHFIRRLRGLIARSTGEDTILLQDAIQLVYFSTSNLDSTRLDSVGINLYGKTVRRNSDDHIQSEDLFWPAGFMDTSALEEEAIFKAWVNKQLDEGE